MILKKLKNIFFKEAPKDPLFEERRNYTWQQFNEDKKKLLAAGIEIPKEIKSGGASGGHFIPFESLDLIQRRDIIIPLLKKIPKKN